eukprot:5652760-Pyramimonas_sp.AAC.1
MVASAGKRFNSARNVASSVSFDGLSRVKCASWMARQLWHTDLTVLDVCSPRPPSSASVDSTLRSSSSHNASHPLSHVVLALVLGPSSFRKVVANVDTCRSLGLLSQNTTSSARHSHFATLSSTRLG